MLQEFKEFIARGNIVDLAVAVIIGGAFGAIVDSLINDIIMPFIGVLMGGQNFSSLAIQVGDATIAYGNFIQTVINFLVIAASIFLMIRTYNKLADKEEEPEPEAEPEPSPEELLLTEIRDLLKEQGQ